MFFELDTKARFIKQLKIILRSVRSNTDCDRGIIRSIPRRNVLISWPCSTACSAWTHVWYTNARCYQSSRLIGVRL